MSRAIVALAIIAAGLGVGIVGRTASNAVTQPIAACCTDRTGR